MANIPFLNNAYFSAKVGIGTDSPSVALQLGNSTLGQTQLAIFNSEGGGEVGLTIQSRTNRAKLRVADNDSNAYVVAEAGKAFFGTSSNGDANNITVLTGGNVGIGTTSPSTRLEVAASATTGVDIAHFSNSNDVVKIKHALDGLGSGITSIFDASNNEDIRLSAQSNSWFNAGYVGIGTTSPGAKLHVYNGVTRLDSGSASSNALGVYSNFSTTAINLFAGSTGSGFINVNSSGMNLGAPWNGGAKFSILNNGNVGIGTTSPQCTLDVRSDASNSVPKIIVGNSTTTYNQTNSGSIVFTEGGTFEHIEITYNGASNKLLFNSPIDSATGLLTINRTGNVGIGTASPGAKLNVAGDILIDSGEYLSWGTAGATSIEGSTASNKLQFRTNSSDRMIIDSSGNVGIGTTSPNAKLHIEDTSGANIILNSATGAVKSGIYLTEGATSAPKQVGAYLSYDGSSNKFSIAIGVGVPADKLTIERDTGLLQLNSYGAGTLVSDASGNITVSSGGGAGGPYLPLAGGTMAGTITMNNNRITSIEELRFNNGGNIGNQINTDVDTGTETVANVEIATYTAAFFDFVIKKTTNVRSGTVYACHDGTNVEFTETSTNDLGDTSDVTLSVDISGTNMRLLATVTSDDWSVKSLIRAI